MRNVKTWGLLLWGILYGAILCAQAPVLSGTWLGNLDQEGGGPFPKYRLRLELKQEGVNVVGIAYINVSDAPEYFAKMKLEGRFDHGIFTYHEITLLDNRHDSDWGWCMKRAELTLKQVGEFRRLEGPWEGYMDDFPCKPGRITLEKLNPQPKPVVTSGAPAVADKPVEARGEFGVVEGRKITHRKEIIVATEQITLYVWDGDKVDGDIISLQYNGQWLLRKYTISKTKKEIQIAVVPGMENQLILFAENVGQYPPNTAAITFFDGKQDRNLALSSDKATCGALKFVVNK